MNNIKKNLSNIILISAFIIFTIIGFILFKEIGKALLMGLVFMLATIPAANSIKKYLKFKNQKYIELTIKIDDIVDIKAYKFGKGSKTMLMISGLTLNGIASAVNNVVEQYKELEDDFTIYLIERRDIVSKDVTLHDLSKDIKKIVDKLELKDLYLYGTSQGGAICMDFTINYPDLVKKLVLASTFTSLNNNEKEVFNKFIDYASKDDYKSINVEFSKLEMSEKYYKQFEELINNTSNIGSHDNCVRFINLTKAMYDFNIDDKISTIKCPTLVMGDKDDKVINIEHSKLIVDKLNCEAYYYEGYGHIVYDLAPDFISRIKKFYLN